VELRLHEKNGKLDEMPCHHKLEECLDAYLKSAGIANDRKGPLFRSAIGKTAQLSARPMLRAVDAGIETAIGCHTFRATGITDYLTNGGRIEVAQRMAGDSNAKTTGLYDRRNDDISVGEVERIGILGVVGGAHLIYVAVAVRETGTFFVTTTAFNPSAGFFWFTVVASSASIQSAWFPHRPGLDISLTCALRPLPVSADQPAHFLDPRLRAAGFAEWFVLVYLRMVLSMRFVWSNVSAGLGSFFPSGYLFETGCAGSPARIAA
jgi:hypothetical protein